MPGPEPGVARLDGPPLPEPSTDTLTETLQRASNDEPDTLFVRFVESDRRWTYSDAWAAALSVARAIREAQPDTVEDPDGTPGAILLFPNCAEFVASFFGAQLAGCAPAPLPAPFMSRGGDRSGFIEYVARVADNAHARVVLARPDLIDHLAPLETDHGLRVVEIEADALSSSDTHVDHVHPSPRQPAMLQYTSGRHHRPRGVLLSHEAILSNVRGFGLTLEMSRDDIGVSWLPLFQDFGLIGGLLSSLYWRTALHQMRTEAFLIRPARWLQEISRTGATMSAAPNFAYRMAVRRIRQRALRDVDLSSWRFSLNGAERVDHATIESFETTFASFGLRSGVIVPAYGLAENGLGVSVGSLGTAADARRFSRRQIVDDGRAVETDANDESSLTLVSNGGPLPGQSVAIVGDDGAVLEPGEIGEILVRSPSVMSGYADDAVGTSARIRDGWLHTGDLGFIHDGGLYITGRLREMLIKHGRNYFLDDIETEASEALELPPASVVAFAGEDERTERLVVLVDDEGRLNAHAEEASQEISSADRIAAWRKRVDKQLLRRLGLRTDRFDVMSPLLQQRVASDSRRDACRARWLARETARQRAASERTPRSDIEAS